MDFEDTYFYEGEELNEYFSKPSIGLALDLGVTYDFLDYFTASLSVLDLGFISWNSTTTATMPQGRVSYEDFEQIDEDVVDEEEQLSALGDELLNIYDECVKANNPDLPLIFTSTSKSPCKYKKEKQMLSHLLFFLWSG